MKTTKSAEIKARCTPEFKEKINEIAKQTECLCFYDYH